LLRDGPSISCANYPRRFLSLREALRRHPGLRCKPATPHTWCTGSRSSDSTSGHQRRRRCRRENPLRIRRNTRTLPRRT